MKKVGIILGVAALFTLTGCASGLNSMQQREYRAMDNAGVLIEEKNPTTGAVLGILPGFGSFYAREPAFGIVNLLFWPLSILWDPVSGYEGSKAINYDVTKQKLNRDMKAELSELDSRLTLEQVTTAEYVIEKRKIEEKYNYQ
jgi:hypothetical protein